ncbi:MAG: enoyl-CoA hydratase/isomerase family protein, partial [Chloroflexi bacterium]|nr:enoyl-CoA hydratase/isomerase family protein [Chloroflexota bacterium]
MNEQILVDNAGSVATITFNRPDQRNAISYEMWRNLVGILDDLEDDVAVRCVVFRGAGDEAFSAGADIKDFDEHRYDSVSAARYAKAFESALDRVERLRCPTISAIQGFCVGGGLELAAATDIRIATKGSRFGVPVNRLGLTAGWDELRRMIAVAGLPAVKYLVLSGRIIDVGDAVRFGLVTAVVADEDLDAEVEKLASQIANGAPLA